MMKQRVKHKRVYKLFLLSIMIFFYLSCITYYNDAVIEVSSDGTCITTPEFEYESEFFPEEGAQVNTEAVDDIIESMK